MKTKREVLDLAEVRVELSEEDKELMAIFPLRRRNAMNDILLVTQGDECYMVSKAALARRKKFIQDAFDAFSIGFPICVVILLVILMCKGLLNPLRFLPVISAIITSTTVSRMAVTQHRRNEEKR